MSGRNGSKLVQAGKLTIAAMLHSKRDTLFIECNSPSSPRKRGTGGSLTELWSRRLGVYQKFNGQQQRIALHVRPSDAEPVVPVAEKWTFSLSYTHLFGSQ